MPNCKKRERVFAMQSLARDGFYVQKFFVRITDDDLEAGILLSQLVYWFTPNAEGKSKLRVKHDGYFWVAKKQEEWYSEICLTPKRYRRAIKVLVDNNLVEKKIYKFNAVPMTHFRLTDHFIDLYHNYLFELMEKIDKED